jgi:CheY-like chemotaxis protein
MKNTSLNILLADDDLDDCTFFKIALSELLPSIHLAAVHDGEQLMNVLTSRGKKDNQPSGFPDAIFVDLNMPRKNGFECLEEIKSNSSLKHLPIIILSTSFEQEGVNRLYDSGAQYFIRKPASFSQFKKIIQQAFINTILPRDFLQPAREHFVLTIQP